MSVNIYYCKNCSKELSGYQKKFCSSSCSAKVNNSKRKPRTTESKAKTSKSIKVAINAGRLVPNKFPSGEKHPLWNDKAKYKQERGCSVCKKMTTNKKYCSRKCQGIDTSVRQSRWLKENRSHIVGRSEPSWMEKSFEEWLIAQGINRGIKGYLNEVRFRNSYTNRNNWADFVFPQQKLIIELDGTQHLKTIEQDQIRDKSLTDRGWKVVRISYSEYQKQTRIDEIKSLLVVPRGLEPRS